MTTRTKKQIHDVEEEPKMAKLRAKFKTADGAHLGFDGMIEDDVAFAVYMLISGWGSGGKHRKKAERTFEQAAQAFLAANKEFRHRDVKAKVPKKKITKKKVVKPAVERATSRRTKRDVAQRRAHEIGASAHENHERWSADQREDLAYAYGYKAWADMPVKLREEAQGWWKTGFADNERAHHG